MCNCHGRVPSHLFPHQTRRRHQETRRSGTEDCCVVPHISIGKFDTKELSSQSMRLCQLHSSLHACSCDKKHNTALCEKQFVRLQTVGQQTESPSSTGRDRVRLVRVRPDRAGPGLVRARRVGVRRVGGPKISRFFPSSAPHSRVFLFSLGCLLVGIWWCFGGPESQLCAFSPLGCRVKPCGPRF